MAVQLFHADGQTDMTELIVAFSNFAKTPNNCPMNPDKRIQGDSDCLCPSTDCCLYDTRLLFLHCCPTSVRALHRPLSVQCTNCFPYNAVRLLSVQCTACCPYNEPTAVRTLLSVCWPDTVPTAVRTMHRQLSGHCTDSLCNWNGCRVIKKFLWTWWLQYRKLQVMFKVSPASLKTLIDTHTKAICYP